jgi:hypothetical protein
MANDRRQNKAQALRVCPKQIYNPAVALCCKSLSTGLSSIFGLTVEPLHYKNYYKNYKNGYLEKKGNRLPRPGWPDAFVKKSPEM